jgi:galactokinase
MSRSPSDVTARASRLFERTFGHCPEIVALAPGRVNLIGEHTDYNGGYVLPMAIDRATVCAAAAAGTGRAEIISAAAGSASFDITASDPAEPHWANYVRGVVALARRRGLVLEGLRLAIDSDVPLGAGLSSSAALEVAVLTALEGLTHTALAPAEKIQLCREAEHTFAGVPCGVMDQSVVVLARAGHALLLDCRTGTTRHAPMADPAIGVLIVNTNVRHELASGEYARRRAECEAAARAMGVASLRDATIERIERAELGPTLTRRSRHVVSENARTLDAADALAAQDWARMGRLMYGSHRSLCDDFEVSSAELDAVVDIARTIGEPGGVWGARMTGGGFGGCVVCLIEVSQATAIAGIVAAEYRSRMRRTATTFTTQASEGACLIE